MSAKGWAVCGSLYSSVVQFVCDSSGGSQQAVELESQPTGWGGRGK